MTLKFGDLVRNNITGGLGIIVTAERGGHTKDRVKVDSWYGGSTFYWDMEFHEPEFYGVFSNGEYREWPLREIRLMQPA